ncbi:MAG: DUF2115 family protein [Clostridiales bacterium]
MDTKALLIQLQEQTANYDLAALKKEYEHYNTDSPLSSDDYDNMNKKFNLETLISLKENQGNFFSEQVNQRYLLKFEDAINNFMDVHAPGDGDFKDYIRILNCYRTFILKIPMHPVGMSLEKGNVTKKGKDYYCSAKKFYMNQPDSLCRFCMAKISDI